MQLITNTNASLNAYSMVDDEKQSELLFYIGLTYFKARNFKKAQKYFNEIILVP